MPWLNHPGYVPLRDDLITRVGQHEVRFRHTPVVLFLCGKFKSPLREELAKYIRQSFPEHLLFYAEDVWDDIATTGVGEDNALELEARLAALADAVILVVESPGTFAELGAFAVSVDLRRKLLPVCDKHYETADSFLNLGPLKWVAQQSSFKPPIQADFDVILLSASELDDRLARIPSPQSRSVRSVDVASGKELVFLVADLVALLAPVTETHLKYYLDGIIGERRRLSVRSLLGLGVAMRLLKRVSPPSRRFPHYYYSINGLSQAYTEPVRQRRGVAELSRQRMRVLAFLQQHDAAREMLEVIWDRK